MSPAFIKGCGEAFPNARITFDKFHVVWHASTAVDKMRRIEQRTDRSLKGLRWSLLKDRSRLSPEAAADLDALIAEMTTVRTARAWVYKKQSLDGELQLEFLPRLCPELNPVEAIWAHVKPHEMANFLAENFAQLNQFARNRLMSMQRRPQLIAAFWRQAELALSLCYATLIRPISGLNHRDLLTHCVRFAPASHPTSGNTRYRPARYGFDRAGPAPAGLRPVGVTE
jgi:hypothetical protein